ncbi:MAG: helix-turn-helix domain-containing protein [Planctomycetes bacterium]|nr:helix-turn-helix domain-containing protein [Planctomycetota bacterium]
MTESAQLIDLLTPETFARIESVFRRHFRLALESAGREGEPVEALSSKEGRPEFCRLVGQEAGGRQRCVAERQRAIEIAAQTGQSYVTICHAGIVLVCVPVVDHDTVYGGVFFGRCLWEPATPMLIEDIENRLRDVHPAGSLGPLGPSGPLNAEGPKGPQGRDPHALAAEDGRATGRGGTALPPGAVARALRALPVVRGPQIHRAAEFLFDLLYEVGGFDARAIRWRRARAEQQSQIGEFIQERKKLGTKWQYPLQSERALVQKVKIGDRTGAKEILNSILGTILFKDIGDLGILKARLLELLTVLSRAAVEGGVEIDTMLEKNLAYVNKAMQIDNQEDLCAWISTALNEFLELVYSSQDARKMTQIRPALEYIDAHYDGPIALAEIARAAHLSVSRLAHVFKEQMGITLIDYVTTVRIERAKELLLGTDQSCTEICFAAGYNNQSYFTRTFKSLVGLTPRQFRVENQRRGLSSKPTE